MQVNAFKGIALAAINLLNMGQSIEDVRKANGLDHVDQATDKIF